MEPSGAKCPLLLIFLSEKNMQLFLCLTTYQYLIFCPLCNSHDLVFICNVIQWNHLLCFCAQRICVLSLRSPWGKVYPCHFLSPLMHSSFFFSPIELYNEELSYFLLRVPIFPPIEWASSLSVSSCDNIKQIYKLFFLVNYYNTGMISSNKTWIDTLQNTFILRIAFMSLNIFLLWIKSTWWTSIIYPIFTQKE